MKMTNDLSFAAVATFTLVWNLKASWREKPVLIFDPVNNLDLSDSLT